MRRKKLGNVRVRETGIFLTFLVLCAIFAILTDRFLTVSNLLNVGRQISIMSLMSIGMTFVILSGGIDLSVGSVLAITGAVTAGLMVNESLPVYLGITGGLMMGGIIGLINGGLIAKVGLPPFIATLGTMTMVRGLAFIYTKGYPIYNLPDSFNVIGKGELLGVPVPIIVLAVGTLGSWLILSNTQFGRHVYAVGGNEEAAKLSGVNVQGVKLMVYFISGLLSGLSGVVLTSRLASALPTVGVGYELDAIAAVIIGGASLSGGSGSVLGTILGALILGVLGNGLNLLNVDTYVMQVVSGGVIVLAVLLDTLRGKMKRDKLLGRYRGGKANEMEVDAGAGGHPA